MYSELEQKAINEKLEQLRKIKRGILLVQELADSISERRVKWIRENLDEMLAKYGKFSPEEQAFRIIYFDHMKINPQHSKMIRVSPTKIRVDSWNFCPYLEACVQLGLDTRHICKEIGEPAIQKMTAVINPNLKFGRNYGNLRPYVSYCEEYFELAPKQP